MSVTESLTLELRIADLEEFKRLADRLHKIAESDEWASADDVRTEVRQALEEFTGEVP